MSERNVIDVIVQINEIIPKDHPIRANGWDRELEKIINNNVYLAPEIYLNTWFDLSRLCIKYLNPYSHEEWTIKVNEIITNKKTDC